jgi:acetyl/propionyl-CoA carboxylase alpha subunit
MIAKLVTWAPTRLEAIDAQATALDAFAIELFLDEARREPAVAPAGMGHQGGEKGDVVADALEEGPLGGAIVRNDTGVEEGGEIAIHYDPMIAKLVTSLRTIAPPSGPSSGGW